MTRNLLLTLPILAALCGCGGGASDGDTQITPMPSDLPGVYAGSFPCSNCKSIAATLWLRDDDRFFLRQSYLDDAGSPDGGSYSYGHWTWDEHAAEIVLLSGGPERRLVRRGADSLALHTSSPTEHLLERDPAAPPFADRVQIDGETAVADTGATFVHCLTGLEVPIANAGAIKELRRQHRLLNPRHKVALTSVEAHFATEPIADSTREVLVVDKILGNIKPGTGCELRVAQP
jgi:hypothetical protein